MLCRVFHDETIQVYGRSKPSIHHLLGTAVRISSFSVAVPDVLACVFSIARSLSTVSPEGLSMLLRYENHSSSGTPLMGALHSPSPWDSKMCFWYQHPACSFSRSIRLLNSSTGECVLLFADRWSFFISTSDSINVEEVHVWSKYHVWHWSKLALF